jgi:hypothetical protein
MANGKLGTADLAALTNTTVYTVPFGKTTSCTVRITNRNGSAVTVRLALSVTGTPALSEWIEYDVLVDGNGIIEDSGLVIAATHNIVAYSNSTGVSVNVYGYEE